MTTFISSRATALCSLAAIAGAMLLGGCASPRVDAQWSDAQRPARSLRGERVLVVCDAYEVVIRRICQDQLAAAVTAHGAVAVIGPEPVPVNPWRPQSAEQLLPAAREAGATAVLSTSVVPGFTTVSSGPSFGFGLGGFGGGGFGGGLGVSVPVGGAQTSSGYTADSQVADVNGGKLVWTAKLSSEASSDVNGQIGQLAKAVVDTAQKAGLF